MTDNKRPAGQGGPHELPRRSGIDDFEDRARAELRKQDKLQVSVTIGEILFDLGPPEKDTEETREYREFLVRLLLEPLDGVNLIPPPPGSDCYQVIVAFRGEQFSDICIRNDILKTSVLAARLCRLNECEIGRLKRPAAGGAE